MSPIPSAQRRITAQRAPRCVAVALWGLAAHGVHANLLLTEIHYNGPASGSDPDEFIELSNSGRTELELSGYRFGSGITFHFDDAAQLGPGESLVIARDSDEFRQTFTAFSGLLFDFSGALSNGGETLTLLDPAGTELWSVRYDDVAPWPTGADGGGDSLQLATNATDLASAGSWLSGAPTPGTWRNAGSDSYSVAAPQPAGLLLAGLAISAVRRRQRRKRRLTGGNNAMPEL